MTKNEIQQTLRNASGLVNRMDKLHIKELLKILTNAQGKNDCAFFLCLDIKKTVKRLLCELAKSDNVDNELSTKQFKQIFTIMGDYNIYPTCKLCGQPIEINSETLKDNVQTKKMFTWDHQYPKSLGGEGTLDNMQPAHKICNNKKADKVLYHRHYNINIGVVCCCDEGGELNKYRPAHFGLRKQDSWCHKNRQHSR